MKENDARHYLMLFLFLLTFSLRLLYLFEMRGHPSFLVIGRGLDSFHFHIEAGEIAGGNILLEGKNYYQAPLYSYVLALVYKVFGVQPQAARVLQAFLSSSSVLLVFLLAGELTGRLPDSFFSAFIFSLYGPSFFYDGVLLKPSLIVFLSLMYSLLMMRSVRSGKHFFPPGLLLGALVLTRPNFLILLPFAIAAFLFFGKKNVLRPSVFFMFGFLAAVLPFALRNIHEGIPFYKISSVGARAVAQGQLPDNARTGWDDSPRGDALLAETQGHIGEVCKAVIAEVRKDPLSWIILQKDKLKALFSWYEYPNNYSYYLSKASSRVLKTAVFSFGPLLVFFLASFFLSAKDIRFRGLFLLIALSFFLCIFPFYPFSRFRMPLASLMAAPSGVFFSLILRRLREKRVLGLLLPGALLAAAFLFPFLASRSFQLVRDVDVFNYGNYFLECRRYPESEDYYLQALKINPGYLPAVNHLGLLYYVQGKYEAARSLWESSLKRDSRQEHLRLWLMRLEVKSAKAAARSSGAE